MRIEISVPEVVSVFKEIQVQPEKVFEMIRLDVREVVEKYISEMRYPNGKRGIMFDRGGCGVSNGEGESGHH